MWRRADVAAALLAVLLAGPGPASGHDAPSLGDEFVKGVFSPNFVPPAAGSYELPAVKRVADFVLRDSTGRSVSTERITAGKAKYARIYGADPTLWRFMTAPSMRVLEGMLESYGQDRTAVYDDRGRFTGRYSHVLKVFLVDRDGDIRNIYSAGFLVPDVVVNDIKTVLAPSVRD